ncbi:hypothetical protein [Aquimarina sp. AU474]|uniref:hypothetical protein n=1 Tax=Aquimarina sp. AU474 TaxID=2108529 RepID=UPI000D6946B6|nr:hypothetical protein [Aquimarina sp. AU474]
MSGEAGAGAITKYFHIFFSSGMTVSVAMPPDAEEHPHYISDYFTEANKPFEKKLEQALPLLNDEIQKLINRLNLPIIVYDPNSDFVRGAINEDTNDFDNTFADEDHANNWFSNSKEPKAFVSIEFMTRSFSKITLSITVKQRILRSQLNKLQDVILSLFE